MSKNIRVVITGGHPSPALATAHQLLNRSVELHWFGANSPSKVGQASYERNLVASQNLPFIAIPAVKFSRHQKLVSLLRLPTLIMAILVAVYNLIKFKPQVIMSFGSYVALPTVIAAKLLRIRVITHEQTLIMGLSNRLISRLADTTTLAYESTRFAPSHSLVVGNPIRSELTKTPVKPDWYQPMPKPLLLVTGGSQGSRAINQQVFADLLSLLSKYQLVHQIGKSDGQVDYKRAVETKSKLPPSLGQYYFPIDNLSASEINFLMTKARAVVCRGGINTLTELLIKLKPALVIPLKKEVNAEQSVNASYFKNLGLVEVLAQDKIEQMTSAISQAESLKPERQTKLGELRLKHLNAAKKLTQLVVDIAN